MAMPGERRIGGAEVTVEIISPFEPPRLLASGTTDEEGCWRQPVEVPSAVGRARRADRRGPLAGG